METEFFINAEGKNYEKTELPKVLPKDSFLLIKIRL